LQILSQILSGQVFVIPIHPGDSPIHLATATQARIMEQIANMLQATASTLVSKQLLMNSKTPPCYLCILADTNFNFVDLPCIHCSPAIPQDYVLRNQPQGA
jgi:hypothetical protein